MKLYAFGLPTIIRKRKVVVGANQSIRPKLFTHYAKIPSVYFTPIEVFLLLLEIVHLIS